MGEGVTIIAQLDQVLGAVWSAGRPGDDMVRTLQSFAPAVDRVLDVASADLTPIVEGGFVGSSVV
jgi:hypothetical protein